MEENNSGHNINNFIVFGRNIHNFEVAKLLSEAGHKVEVLTYGAQVLAWRGPKNEEYLFTSDKAVYQQGKPVRGGIPLIFPQFGKGELPSHGFARTSNWQVKETRMAAPGVPSITFKLDDSKPTHDIWPHRFGLEYTVTIGDALKTELKVTNRGDSSFSFSAGFHTYFRISDISKVKIEGLGGVTYLDSLKGRAPFLQPQGPLVFAQQTDSVYVDTPDKVRIVDDRTGREYLITKSNIADLVVWNPWLDGSKAFTDLSPSEYLGFVCAEPIIVNRKIQLPPGGEFICGQDLEVNHLQ